MLREEPSGFECTYSHPSKNEGWDTVDGKVKSGEQECSPYMSTSVFAKRLARGLKPHII